ncbi:uncharacterized protein [Nicotiana sylvestris]|uniref:uncharacterized protein n=1 Tax=Nicotiana sylvestris TaxID=4096 RepID=UPI00388C901F
MDASIYPQPLAVGEATQNTNVTHPNVIPKQSYAALVYKGKSAVVSSKLELKPVNMVHGEPTIEFLTEDVNAFTIEEGLHQAVILKFSYGKPDIQELRQLIPKQFDVKGYCNVRQLEYRHIFVRFDLFDDFVQVLSKTTGYVKAKGDEFFFRSFPWSMGFNPRKETFRAIVWISMPDMPANFFAKKSLISIASAVGKPLVVDKATQDRMRPSMARVKEIVYDNLPQFCTCGKHQGHDERSCRWRIENRKEDVVERDEVEDLGSVEKLQGDAREFLNSKRVRQLIGEAEQQRSEQEQVVQTVG